MRQCDECGRKTAKLTRIYRGHGYCSTCYARVFKWRACPTCGEQARLPKGFDSAVCRKCERRRPCARCGASDYKAGLVTPYGPVCNACAHYFRDVRACPQCGRLSRRLSRAFRFGIYVPVCEKCRCVDHGTCTFCRRYRLLESDAKGRAICRTCRRDGPKFCESCGESMPAGRGKLCERCYWVGVLERRVVIACEGFSNTVGAEWFRQFGSWLLGHVGAQKAAITVNRYFSFFCELASMGDRMPTVEVLLERFTVLRLRRNLLPMRFLEQAGHLAVTKVDKEAASERRRIGSLLEQMPPNNQMGEILRGYHAHLMSKVTFGCIGLRSVRLALKPAVAMCRMGSERRHEQPSQMLVEAYLKCTPGQRAAVSGFVRYLREQFGLAVFLPRPIKRSSVAKRQKVEARLAEMIHGGLSNGQLQHALELMLRHFHGLSKSAAKAMAQPSAVRADQNGDWALVHKRRHYWLPRELGLLFGDV